MSKFTPIAIILGGAGGLAGSYHVAPKHNNKSVSPKINVLFRDKYKNPLLSLNGDKEIWDSKWNLLKTGKPVHPKLQESIKIKDQESKSKNLHKEGCEEIYNSTIMATPYLLDFVNYCSKTNKDATGKKWITDEITQPTKKQKFDPKKEREKEYNKKLEVLKKTDKKNLSASMLELKSKLDPNPKKLSEENRKELEDWCNLVGSKMYLYKDGEDIRDARVFCVRD